MLLVSASRGGRGGVQEHIEKGNSNHQGHKAAILRGDAETAEIPQFGGKAEGGLIMFCGVMKGADKVRAELLFRSTLV